MLERQLIILPCLTCIRTDILDHKNYSLRLNVNIPYCIICYIFHEYTSQHGILKPGGNRKETEKGKPINK